MLDSLGSFGNKIVGLEVMDMKRTSGLETMSDSLDYFKCTCDVCIYDYLHGVGMPSIELTAKSYLWTPAVWNNLLSNAVRNKVFCKLWLISLNQL